MTDMSKLQEILRFIEHLRQCVHKYGCTPSAINTFFMEAELKIRSVFDE